MSMKNRSLVTIHGGQCGVQCAPKFWSMMEKEHGIGMQKRLKGEDNGNVNAIFREKSDGKFQPRCILFDLDPSTIDFLQTSADKQMFQGTSMVSGSESGGNCYARARYAQGMEIIPLVRNALRIEMEGCDTCQSIIHNCATSGGTGSGLMADILTAENTKKTMLSFGINVYCSKSVDNMSGYYNTVLHMNSMSDVVDLNIMLDNESLYNIGNSRYHPQGKLTFGDINQEIAAMFSCLTTGERLPTENIDIVKFQSALVPYMGLNYISATMGSYYEPDDRELPFVNLIQCAFDGVPSISIDTKLGKYLGSYMLTRGDTNRTYETFSQLQNLMDRKMFAEWIPCKLSIAHCDKSIPIAIPPFNVNPHSVCHFYNHSAITQLFEEYSNWFGIGYSKKAFRHWYLDYGMQEGEMEEALQSLSILRRVYNSVSGLGESASRPR